MVKYGITLDIVLTLEYLSIIDGGGLFLYSGDASANTQTAYNALTWSDPRPKPTWSDILANWADARNNYYAVSVGALQDVEDCYEQLDAEKSPLAHSHTIGNVTGLTAALAAIPAAQVSSDWNAVSGIAQILNKPSIPSIPSRSQSSATRSLNSAFQVSSTRDSMVCYSVQIQVTASIAGGQNGDVILEMASNSAFTTNVQTLAASGLGQTYTLAVALQGVQPQTQPVFGFVPAGYYVRLRTVNNTGTPTFTYRYGQETLL